MIKLSHVVRMVENQPLFEPISGQLLAGQVWWIQGPNGSGKTSLLRMLSGLLSYEGSIVWQGQSIEQCMDVYSENRSYLGHRHGLYEDVSGVENLALARTWQATCVPDQILEDAKTALGFQAFAHRPIHRLSEGQQRKVAWLRLLQSGAKLWLLDEPFNALDDCAHHYVRQCCQRHLDQGGAVVLTSHQSDAPLPNCHTIQLKGA